MAVEVRDVALEHYSASAVLVRFPGGEKVWLPLGEINQIPASWALPESMAQRRGKHLLITDWIAKQKGFKATQRELDIDPERAADAPIAPAQTTKTEPVADALLLGNIRRLERDLRDVRGDLSVARAGISQAQLACNQARSELRDAQAQRDKAVADLKRREVADGVPLSFVQVEQLRYR